MKKYLAAISLVFLSLINAHAQSRITIPFNDNWNYYPAYNFERKAPKEAVTLPHSWNVQELLDGKMEYRRTAGFYEKTFPLQAAWKDKRVFLHFEGINSVADVWMNNRFLTRHKGGYTAFTVEITNWIKQGDNRLLVMANNAFRNDVLPLHGDFNIYGGIHRPVSLMVTSKDCISPLDYGAAGVYISPLNVSHKKADLKIETKLSLQRSSKALSIRTSIFDAKNNLVTQAIKPIAYAQQSIQNFTIQNPTLWNGKKDPYLYSIKVELLKNKQPIDEVVQPLGLRYFRVDVDKGFFLNGKYLDLVGFGKHDDFFGKGSAVGKDELEKDIQLINEIGATSVRLTHYPHNKYFYDLCDKNGLVLWTEIPFIGPGGYTGTGYVKDAELEESITNTTIEMVKQHYNNPSVFFWGLGNELLLNYDDPQLFLEKLNKQVKQLDPSRLTTYASNQGLDDFTKVSDILAWNKYFGWYEHDFDFIGRWADSAHKHLPKKPIAVSEYGAGASPYKHYEKLEKVSPAGKFHPEEWQVAFHETHWREFIKRPFLWGKYIWVFADFSSSIRTEGDHDGINDKGLVTYDRKLKKDVFFFYKANWNPEPMIYISERRNDKRMNSFTHVKVYCNAGDAELFVNGVSFGKKNSDEVKIIRWENVPLQKGSNTIKVVADKNLVDEVNWELE